MKTILRHEKKIIAVFLVFMGVLSVFFGYFAVKNGEPYTTEKKVALSTEDYGAENGIDINSAKKEELCQLKGVGEKISERILKARDEMGGFKSVDDLLYVDGIGKSKIKDIKKAAKVIKEQ